MKNNLKTPCSECPWRRKHPAGWLGGYEPEEFTSQIQFDGPPIPCHKTLGGSGKESICRGSLIYMKNQCKLPYHPEYPVGVMEDVQQDVEGIFQWPHEFLEYHSDPDAWVKKAKERIKAD